MPIFQVFSYPNVSSIDLLMLTIESLITVISLCLTCFSLGYSLDRNSKTQKDNILVSASTWVSSWVFSSNRTPANGIETTIEFSLNSYVFLPYTSVILDACVSRLFSIIINFYSLYVFLIHCSFVI